MPIELRTGYSINSCYCELNKDSRWSTLQALERLKDIVHKGIKLSKADGSYNPSVCASVQMRIGYLDEILLPHLTQDFATVEKVSSSIQNEIETQEAFLKRFYLTQEDKDLKLREMEERRHRFFVSLWREMEWSKKIFNMMNGISA